MRNVGCAIIILLSIPAPAEAGRSHFGWLFGSEIIPRRGVELEMWIIDINQLHKPDDVKVHETQTWLGFVFALSEHLEMAVAVEAEYADSTDPAEPPATNLAKFGGDVRWRPQAPQTKGLTNLFRLGVKKLVQDRAGIRMEANVVTSFERAGIVVSLDAGLIEEHLPDEDVLELHSGIGVSARVVNGFRLGAEAWAELTLVGPDPGWIVIGPTVSLTSGRLWGAATFGVGVLGIRDAGRITMGVVL